jgi:hypothetical protein
MTRSRLALLLAVVVAVPAAAAAGGSFFGAAPQPCFASGAAAYRLSGSTHADYIVRIDNAAARPDLRLQLVDEPEVADFVLMDDGDSADACREAAAVKTFRIEIGAANPAGKPDMTVALSRQAAEGDRKIFVRSVNFSEQDAAALFAVIWKNSHGREFLARR